MYAHLPDNLPTDPACLADLCWMLLATAVCAANHYNTLGVRKQASQVDIKKVR